MKRILNYSLALFFVTYAVAQFSNEIKVASRGFYCVYVVAALLIIACSKEKKFILNKCDYIYVLCLFIWWGTGVINGFYDTAFSEFIAFVLLWVSCKTAYISFVNGILYMRMIKKSIYTMMTIWFLLYVVFAIGILTDVIPSFITNSMMESWYENRGMDVKVGFSSGFLGMFPRFSTGLNIVPLIIFFMYCLEKRSKSSWLICWLCVGFILVDYGRLDMVIAFLAIVNFVRYKLLENVTNVKLCIMFTSLFAISLILMFNFKESYDYFSFGFLNERTYYSDMERKIQFEELQKSIEDNLWFGIGMGGYLTTCIRSVDYWQYELQLLAFMMQFGVCGCVVIIGSFFAQQFFQLRRCVKKRIGPVCVMLLFWLGGSSIQGGIFFDGKIILPILLLLASDNNMFIKEERLK